MFPKWSEINFHGRACYFMACNRVISARVSSRVPLDWAMTQNNLGMNAHRLIVACALANLFIARRHLLRREVA